MATIAKHLKLMLRAMAEAEGCWEWPKTITWEFGKFGCGIVVMFFLWTFEECIYSGSL